MSQDAWDLRGVPLMQQVQDPADEHSWFNAESN